MAATQFQPIYARYAFPCFDEPQLKVPFSLQILAPAQNMLVLSNMRGSAEAADPVTGTQLWTFPATVPLSTYNMAWIITKRMDKISTTYRRDFQDPYTNVEITVYTRPGAAAYAEFALNTTVRFLTALNKMLRPVFYPLNKLDIIALPECDSFPSFLHQASPKTAPPKLLVLNSRIPTGVWLLWRKL